MAAFSELVASNKLNSLKLQVNNAVYDGGKFDIVQGNYMAKSSAEKFINCAVFVISLLKSFDYTIVDWNTFPNPIAGNRNYLDDWLVANNIPPMNLVTIIIKQKKFGANTYLSARLPKPNHPLIMKSSP